MTGQDHGDVLLPTLGEGTAVVGTAAGPALRGSERWRGALALYLPVLIMAGLAGLTWWLMQSTVGAGVSAQPRPVRHEADYEMRGFSIWRSGGEVVSATHGLIEGQRLQHYPDTATLEMDGLRLRWVDAEGQRTHVVAGRAVAREDGQEVQLFGEARVVREAVAAATASGSSLEFVGSNMHIDAHRERIHADSPVIVYTPHGVFRAQGMSYDHASGLLDMQGGVQGEWRP